MENIADSGQKQFQRNSEIDSNNQIQVRLLPDGYKNELFENNMRYFHAEKPELFELLNDYRCDEFRICLNPDGSPNIYHMESRSLVYGTKTTGEILSEVRDLIGDMCLLLRFQREHVMLDEDRGVNVDPIQTKMYRDLYHLGPYGQNDVGRDIVKYSAYFKTDFCPYIRVYGVGLGYQLIELIKAKTISYMDIYEPNPDLFYISLFTVPWELVFRYFELKNGALYLNIAASPDEVIESNMQRLWDFRYLTTALSRYMNLEGSNEINHVINREDKTDIQILYQNNSGWYEDQRAGLYYATRNIKQRHPAFNGKKVDKFLRAFVVGSGPSLNESIDYIKHNQNEALIFSCGSALTPLLKNGIIPDYEIVQERTWHVEKIEENHDDRLLKRITLLKLNVVSTVPDASYRKVLVVQKANDPGSTLLGSNYPVVLAVNPTVTNAGVSIAAELGADEIYLFGLDYGAPAGSGRMHASNSLYDNDGKYGKLKKDSVAHETRLEGNFGETIETTHILAASLKATEHRIKMHPSIRWLNVGSGALIRGTVAYQPDDLPKISRRLNKASIIREIGRCFDADYDDEFIIKELVDTAQKQVSDYFDAIMMFADSKPANREEIHQVLRLMNQAVEYKEHWKSASYLPPKLLNGGIQEFVRNVYSQVSISADDVVAVEFFNSALRVLGNYRDDIVKDLGTLLDYIVSDDEVIVQRSY